jgi:hypothetical protein
MASYTTNFIFTSSCPTSSSKKTKEAAVVLALLLLFIGFSTKNDFFALIHFIFIAIGVVNKI